MTSLLRLIIGSVVAVVLGVALAQPAMAQLPYGDTPQVITGNGYHSCAIGVDDRSFCWGANDRGQLGNGTVDESNVGVTDPTPVSAPDGVTFTTLATGLEHSCALGDDGKTYCWGDNTNGELGRGSSDTDPHPVPAAVTMPSGVTFTALTSGSRFQCALGDDSKVYCWGKNDFGQLGSDTGGADVLVPTAMAPSGLTFTSITSGDYSTCALTTDGHAYCWGSNQYGQLGIGAADGAQHPAPEAVQLPGGSTALNIDVGSVNACVAGTDHIVYCWGYNGDGGLGIGTKGPDVPTPGPVTMPPGASFTTVGTGPFHTCALTTAGAAYCWGYNAKGAIGDGTTTERLTPTAVTMPTGAGFVTISANAGGTCALGDNERAYCWGYNRKGGVGDGTTVDRHIPTLVDMLPQAPQAIKATAGDAQITVSWGQADLAGQPLVHYTATATASGKTSHSCTTTEASCVITGLANGTTYRVVATTTTDAGDSTPSVVAAVTPSAPAPTPTPSPSGTGEASGEELAPTGVAGAAPSAAAAILMLAVGAILTRAARRTLPKD